MGQKLVKNAKIEKFKCNILIDHIVWKSTKMSRILIFSILEFSPIFGLLKMTCLVTLFACKLQVFKYRQNRLFLAFSMKSCRIENNLSGHTVWPKTSGFHKIAKMTIFWHFWWAFVIVARFARNVECDFLWIFKHCDFSDVIREEKRKKRRL